MYACKTCGDAVESIIEIVTHECDQILRAEDLTPKEQNTLLYINSRVVDMSGELSHEQMNFEDQQNIKLFRATGILEVEEFQVAEIKEGYWDLVKGCQKERAERNNNGKMEMNYE